ncbi:MAG: hypothetical protein JRJ66_15300 [Deltaproteobacteria bacterium]|nr:hypothetical protein [Deltaproteobacteria bacterium]
MAKEKQKRGLFGWLKKGPWILTLAAIVALLVFVVSVMIINSRKPQYHDVRSLGESQ